MIQVVQAVVINPFPALADGAFLEMMMATFEQELAQLLNSYSKENESNTPDFILAQYMIACLDAFTKASRDREKWYGKELKI